MRVAQALSLGWLHQPRLERLNMAAMERTAVAVQCWKVCKWHFRGGTVLKALSLAPLTTLGPELPRHYQHRMILFPRFHAVWFVGGLITWHCRAQLDLTLWNQESDLKSTDLHGRIFEACSFCASCAKFQLFRKGSRANAGGANNLPGRKRNDAHLWALNTHGRYWPTVKLKARQHELILKQWRQNSSHYSALAQKQSFPEESGHLASTSFKSSFR